MGKGDLTKLKEGLKKTEKYRTIISAGRGVKEELKAHAHFYISTALLDKMREFQVKHRERFPRISHVIEEALKEFLEKQ
ncbi:MAG: hypothetical protein COZ37_06950 [bacterium (Candidatus Ratteibacteria) CG_4_10_14_3_um_filter_41_18]|uniref:Ribbon-helix-helix protein CopG domain-containing protein n=3 Tax=Candidatus Ratteibacteria TaxID=2979319 RepID=A0A2M7YEE4_9BACT|nr:MAG: hypothetical protein COS11_08040 [bacterium (Candidatus Ratteibacteria) CG01_land_8_20_14_3_00_40_19]PIX76616.1 MAG: hypothetical protein COZ37_06950 [bacterium (Candidatus Ratteibacteria) CG_4_10_14_3_um_filter_41_18]PJA61360.1 MAG: hypothetical protein CO162_06740 [bacterium (Candidatus Ratteibacteria) CG_4_9_14_3_um_filter_41_21]